MSLIPFFLTSAARFLPVQKPLKWMQKATRAWSLGTSLTCKGQIVFSETQQRKQCPQTTCAGRWLAPFCPSPQSSCTHVSEVFEERVDGASGASRRGGWGGMKAMSGLVFPHHPQKAPPSFGSLLTWNTNETPWDPKIAPFTAARHPFIAQPLCSPRLLLRWHFRGQSLWTPASMSFENRNGHKGPIMILSMFFRICPNP